MWDDIGKFLETVGSIAGQSLSRNAEHQRGYHSGLIPALLEAPEAMSEQAAQKKALADRQTAAQQFLAARGLTAPQAQAGAQLVTSGTPISSLLPKAAPRTPMDANHVFAARQLGLSPDSSTWTPAQANAIEAQVAKNRPAASSKVNLSGFSGYLAANGIDPNAYMALPAAQRKTLHQGYLQEQTALARARVLPLPPDLVPTTAGGVSGVVPIPRVRGASSVKPGPFVPLGPGVTAGKSAGGPKPLTPTQRVTFANGLDKMAEAAWAQQPSHPITAAEEFLPGGGNRKAKFLNDYKTLKAGLMGYDTEGNPLPDGTRIGTDANGNPLIWRSK